jgi:hypothetical protein
MFGKVKRWLGIEGVKVEIIVPEFFQLNSGTLSGKLRFISMADQQVTAVELKFIEKYKRGRRGKKLIDEYTLGEIVLQEPFIVNANEEVFVDFVLPFEPLKSEMDMFQEKNFITRGVINAAKFIKGVNSDYRIEARANVKGTALHPFDVKVLKQE